MSPRHPRTLAATLSQRDLPLAELHAARLDGEVVAVAECFSVIDEPDDPHHRARALALSVPPRLIAERFSAAWVLGASELPPGRHQFCVDSNARVSLSSTARHELREVVIDDAEILSIAGLRVTSAMRTAIDIARSSAPFGEMECSVVAALMGIGGFGLAECIAAMNGRRNLPGKRIAAARIRESDRSAA